MLKHVVCPTAPLLSTGSASQNGTERRFLPSSSASAVGSGSPRSTLEKKAHAIRSRHTSSRTSTTANNNNNNNSKAQQHESNRESNVKAQQPTVSGQYVTILAIYDEQEDGLLKPAAASSGLGSINASSNTSAGTDWSRASGASHSSGHHSLQPPTSHAAAGHSSASPASTTSDRSPLAVNTRPAVVEITSLDQPPRTGLLVLRDQLEQTANREVARKHKQWTVTDLDDAHSPQSTTVTIDCGHRPAPTGMSQSLTAPDIRQAAADDDDEMDERDETISPLHSTEVLNGGSGRHGANNHGNGSGRFARNGARQSSLADAWMVAADRIEQQYKANEQKEASAEESPEPETVRPSTSGLQPQSVNVTLTNSDAKMPFAVKVEAEYSQAPNKLSSVRVCDISPVLQRLLDNQLQLHDRITHISGRPVYQMSAIRAQTYLHELWQSGKLELVVERMLPANGNGTADGGGGDLTQVRQSTLQKANTKKIGRKIEIQLTKGAEGLGFTVTSRDTDGGVGGGRPFYIRTVLPTGAAISDGRLRAGDRLLEVGDREVTGETQSAVVDILRQFKAGDTVRLLVSRQPDTEADEGSPPLVNGHSTPLSNGSQNGGNGQLAVSPLPRPIEPAAGGSSYNGNASASAVETSVVVHDRHKQLMCLDIALNDTGSAGLGVSVKGRKLVEKDDHSVQTDCGIYVKAIMHGGAAFKDGRLRVNDQLVAINDVDLRGLSNEAAMKLISKTMQKVGHRARSIRLSVLRVVTAVPSQSHPSTDSAMSTSTTTTVPLTHNKPPAPLPPHMHNSNPSSYDGESFYLSLDNVQQQQRGRPAVQPNGPARHVVPGYGEYAVVVKDAADRAPSAQQAERRQQPVNIYEDIDAVSVASSSASSRRDAAATDFQRDAPTRRSMSEKRHGQGGKADPSHSETFQKIKHARQISAPSLVEPSAYNKRHTTLAVTDAAGNVSLSSPLRASTPKQPVLRKKENQSMASNGLQRRSMSLESLSATAQVNSSPMIVELAANAERGVDVKSPLPPGMPVSNSVHNSRHSLHDSLPRKTKSNARQQPIIMSHGVNDPNRSSHKEKKERKSMMLPSWLRFGSNRSRGESPDKEFGVGKPKTPTLPEATGRQHSTSSPAGSSGGVNGNSRAQQQQRAAQAAIEEQRRINAEYIKFKRQQEQEEGPQAMVWNGSGRRIQPSYTLQPIQQYNNAVHHSRMHGSVDSSGSGSMMAPPPPVPAHAAQPPPYASVVAVGQARPATGYYGPGKHVQHDPMEQSLPTYDQYNWISSTTGSIDRLVDRNSRRAPHLPDPDSYAPHTQAAPTRRSAAPQQARRRPVVQVPLISPRQPTYLATPQTRSDTRSGSTGRAHSQPWAASSTSAVTASRSSPAVHSISHQVAVHSTPTSSEYDYAQLLRPHKQQQLTTTTTGSRPSMMQSTPFAPTLVSPQPQQQQQPRAAPIARQRQYRPKSNYCDYKRRVVTDDHQSIHTQQYSVGRSNFFDDRLV